LSTPPADAYVFDLKYRAQTGATDDIAYYSFWGYGGDTEVDKRNAFSQEVSTKASGLYYLQSPSLKKREWAAVEYKGRDALALYFDLNGDGHFSDHERILPTTREHQEFNFITPDFMQTLEGGGETLCRVLVKVSFYDGSTEPNVIWSPAALLEGSGAVEGRPARLLLFASGPGGAFDAFGSSCYSLLLGDEGKVNGRMYVSREILSSVIACENEFYRLSIDGRRSNGLPARAVLVKDKSPCGDLAVKLVGSNAFPATLTSLYLQGVNDRTVSFRMMNSKDRVKLPAGTYRLSNGMAVYGESNSHGPKWELWFQQGPEATIKAGGVTEIALGQPTLAVRAIEEKNRYDHSARGLTSFKRGTRIYLEPKIIGKSQEIFGRFREGGGDVAEKVARPPTATITGPDGKQLLSSTMEYG
jgi:hypothetical protein